MKQITANVAYNNDAGEIQLKNGFHLVVDCSILSTQTQK